MKNSQEQIMQKQFPVITPSSFAHGFSSIQQIPQISYEGQQSSFTKLVDKVYKTKQIDQFNQQKNKDSENTNANTNTNNKYLQIIRNPQNSNIIKQQHINQQQRNMNITNNVNLVPNLNLQQNKRDKIIDKSEKIVQINKGNNQEKQFNNFEKIIKNPFADESLEIVSKANNKINQNEIEIKFEVQKNPFASQAFIPTMPIIDINQQLIKRSSNNQEEEIFWKEQLMNAKQFYNVLGSSYSGYVEYHSRLPVNKYLIRTNRQSIMHPQPTFRSKRLSFKKKNINNNSFINSINYPIKQSINYKTLSTWLYRLIQKQNKIYVYNIEQPDKLPVKDLKPTHIIKLPKSEHFSPNIQVQTTTSRLITFSNSHQQIVIFSLRSKQLICRLQIEQKRYNPVLHLTSVKQQTVLLIIGGYDVPNDDHVEGKKSIEMFLIDKWSIVLKQKIIKTLLSRVHPLVFGVGSTFDEQGIVILGGNSTAFYRKKQISRSELTSKDLLQDKIDPNDIFLDFNEYPQINESVNKTGFILNNSSLLQLINNQNEVLIPIMLNVKIDYPQYLYGGCAIFLKNLNNKLDNLRIVLPHKDRLHLIKFINKQVHIEQSRQYFQNQQLLNSKMEIYKNNNNQHQIITIKPNGSLKITSIELIENLNKSSKICKMCKCMIM